jgi:hypothetical protein
MTDAAAVAAHKAGCREWIGLAVIALPCLLYSMDLTVLNLAVVSADLKPSSTQLLWIIDGRGRAATGPWRQSGGTCRFRRGSFDDRVEAGLARKT